MLIEELYGVYKRHPSVETDTRKLKPGDLFFALRGSNYNGNDFAAQAIEAGASFAVIDEKSAEIPGKTILTGDVLTTLQGLAKYHRLQFSIPFIAITGSNGKTTTKELIHAVLSSVFKTYTTEGNLNNHIGIPLTLLKIREDARLAVIEMGANHLNEIASYCRYTAPTHGLITNCGKAHLEGFGSEENIRKAKGELFDHLRENGGTAFVMWDYDYLRDMSKGIPHIIRYGTGDVPVQGKLLTSDPYLNVSITGENLNFVLHTQLVGEYNLANVLAAVAVGKYFGVAGEKIKASIENYIPSNSRSQLIKKGTNTIILDAYNANPSSMKLAIENFAKLQAPNKVLVLGAMAELGKDSLAEHQALANQIQQYSWKQVLLTGADFLKIRQPFPVFESAIRVQEWLKEQRFENTYFLIKGSRSQQMEKVLEGV